MKLSVIIPTYNEENYIADCLQSLMKQTEKPDEIIVVDNNSTDKTAEIAKTFPGVKVVNEKKQGMIPARNKGFDSAQYDIIARTDADTIVPKNWIKRIKKHFADEKIVGVSGPARFVGLDAVRTSAYWRSELLFFRSFRRMLGYNTLFGPNMALRASAWKKIRRVVCLSDSAVHEDVDLGIHLSSVGTTDFDRKLVVTSSSRRWKHIAPHFEYPYRYIKTIQLHNKYFLALKKHTKRIRTMIQASLKNPLQSL